MRQDAALSLVERRRGRRDISLSPERQAQSVPIYYSDYGDVRQPNAYNEEWRTRRPEREGQRQRGYDADEERIRKSRRSRWSER